MKPDEYKLVAERLREVFSEARTTRRKPAPATPVTDITGCWNVDVKFALGEARHLLFLEVHGSVVSGKHVGTRVRGELSGVIDGEKVRLRSVLPFEGSELRYLFEGTVSGDRMAGELDLGEYPRGRWEATRCRDRARS